MGHLTWPGDTKCSPDYQAEHGMNITIHPLTSGLPAVLTCILKRMHPDPLLVIHLDCFGTRGPISFIYFHIHLFISVVLI